MRDEMEEEDTDDEQLALTLVAAVARGMQNQSRGGKRLSQAERRSLAASVIQLLLQPTSPRESDDEDDNPPL